MTLSDDFIKFSAITGPGNEKRKSVVRPSSPVKCRLHRQLHVFCF